MKKKNIILLTLGYLGGIAIAMKFSKKNAVETKKSLEKNPNFWDHFVENVVSIHKEVFRFFEEKAMSDDNMKLLEEYKGKAKSEVEKFKKEAESRIEELKEKGVKKKEEIEKELLAIYEKRQQYFDKAKETSEDYMEEGMELAKEYVEEGRKRLDKAFEDMKKKISK